MRRYVSVASSFFAIGAIVGLAWLFYLSAAIGETPHPVTAMKISFPGIFVRWPGMPRDGLTGGAILVFFALSTFANGLIYSVVATGVYAVLRRV
jgi:hypothetical protein